MSEDSLGVDDYCQEGDLFSINIREPIEEQFEMKDQ